MPPIHHDPLPGRRVQGQHHSHLGSGEVGQARVLQAVGCELVPLPVARELHRLRAAAGLALKTVDGEKLGEFKRLPEAKLAGLEDVHRLPHPDVGPCRVKPPVLDDVGDVKADSVEGAEARRGV